MAAQAATYEGLLKDIRARRTAPVYLLHGEEGYYLDRLLEAFEAAVPDDEKAFNLYTLYACDTNAAAVADICRRIPVLADHQTVIVKEMQAERADSFARLKSYLADPVPTTTLVICFRGEKAKGKELLAALNKAGAVVFESPKTTDYNAPAVIGSYIRSKGLGAEPKALEMIRDFVGTDLTRIFGEVDKLVQMLPSGATVTPEVVERNIGISREFNSFELVDAIAVRDAAKCFRIAAYFRANPKNAKLVMVSATIFNFFADLLTAHYAPDRNPDALATLLGIRNRMGLKRISDGLRNYNAVRTVEILSAIRDFDIQSKGVESRRNEHDLFHELIYHILTAPGVV